MIEKRCFGESLNLPYFWDCKQRVTQETFPPAKLDLDSGWLAGRTVAFVGKLGSINRRMARQIVREASGATADHPDASVDLIVIGADQSPSDDYAALLSDEVIERAGNGQLEIISETDWWQRLGMVDDDGTTTRRLYTPAMLADLLEVPISTIRRWHRRGLIRPAMQIHRLPYFDFVEVASARQLARLVANGHSPKLIESKLARLAERFPEFQKPLSQLPVILEGRDVLMRVGDGLVESSGQMRIDFEAMADDAESRLAEENLSATDNEHVVGFPGAKDSLAGPKTDVEFLEMASDLEDDGRTEEAIQVYRSMILACGVSADPVFRMAELLYAAGQSAAARERYSMAIELAPDFVEARASLGCVLVDLQEPDQAIAAFQGALDIHPDYPDVHFHLARLLDERRLPDEAESHWQTFLRLAPQSPWAAEARQRLGLDFVSDDDG